jgi:hypothetical protein
MNKSIEIIRQPRLRLIEITGALSIEQLNKVQAGFNNNIIWNIGHMIAAQQGICYRRAGLSLKVNDAFFETYKPETKPERFIDDAELSEIKGLLVSTLDELEADYNANLFDNYTPFVTRYGVNIAGIDDAISFLPFHEGLHLGCILALKRLVS